MTLNMIIDYNMNTNTFEITGSLNEEGQREVLEAFIHSQIGTGKDPAQAVERDAYRIEIRWDPDGDQLSSSYDTGNKGLRDGILLDVLRRL